MHLTFTPPLSGLDPLTEYELSPLDGAPGLFALRSLERPEIRLFVLDPALYVPDFRPDIPGAPADAQVLVVVTPGRGGSTVNLLAPLVIDAENGTARQTILADDVERVRTPLTASAPAV